MFKSNFGSLALTGIGLVARDSSPEEALKMTPAPHINKAANMIAWYAVNILLIQTSKI